MIIAIFAAALLDAAPAVDASTLHASTLGACAWSHVSAADKADIAAAYQRDAATDMAAHSRELGQAFQAKKAAFDAAFAQCDATPGIPARWSEGVVAAEAEKFGTATLLETSRHLTRADLDADWRDAPEDARQCALVDAARFYGATDKTCANISSTGWFLTHLGIKRSDTGARDDAMLIISYMHATAEGGVAAALIARFERTNGAAASSSAS